MSLSECEPPDENLPTIERVADRLLDAATAGEFELSLPSVQTQIDRAREQLDSAECFRYQLLVFDLALISTVRSDVQAICAENLLLAALDLGDSSWNAIRQNSRLQEFERLALTSDAGIDLLELLAYAPDPGMREFAISQLVAIGLRLLDSGNDSRRFERLLHGVGASAEAYRLEEIRKLHIRGDASRFGRKRMETPAPPYRVIAIAGGHTRMRATAASLLEQHGMSVVSIPSSREAVRRERDILQALHGCDAVLLMVRQITHSTSDQVRKSAERLDIPVIFSHAASALAIERELFGIDQTHRPKSGT